MSYTWYGLRRLQGAGLVNKINKKLAVLSIIIAIFVHLYVKSIAEDKKQLQNEPSALYLRKQGDISYEQTNSASSKKTNKRNHQRD